MMSLCSLQDTMKYFTFVAAPFNKLPYFYIVSTLKLNFFVIFIYFILFYLILSYFILSYFILFYFVLFCFVLFIFASTGH